MSLNLVGETQWQFSALRIFPWDVDVLGAIHPVEVLRNVGKKRENTQGKHTEHVMLKMIVMIRNMVGNENDVAKTTTTIMRVKMTTMKMEVMITGFSQIFVVPIPIPILIIFVIETVMTINTFKL